MPAEEATPWPTARTFAVFAVVAIASSTLSDWSRKLTRLPLITGYIAGGVLCGPYAIAILSRPESLQLAKLVTDDAMGFIGFSAGSKFLLSELSGSLKPVLTLLGGLVGTTYLLVLSGMLLAAPLLPLMDGVTTGRALAIALIIACLAVARSPSSAIAIVSELSAHGTFTTIALSVTVLMDVVVVLFFSLTLLIVHAIDPSEGQESPAVADVLGLFALQMIVSVIIGILLGYILHLLIQCSAAGLTTAVKRSTSYTAPEPTDISAVPTPPPSPPPAVAKSSGSVSFGADEGGASRESKPRPAQLRRFNSVIGASQHGGAASAAAAARLSGYKEKAAGALFLTEDAAAHRSAALLAALWLSAKLALNISESLVLQLTGFEVFETEEMEEKLFGHGFHQPLVISMVAGFVVVNYTSSRRSFLRILHDSSEPVYIAFFTLTGMTLQLDALLPNLPTAALIFGLRFAGISVGSYWGGRLGGSSQQHYERYWMAFITQAGVALGLAQRVASQFVYGPALALCVTAEVVVNQLLGPLLFKAAIISVGEAHNEYTPSNKEPAKLGVSAPTRPQPRNAVIVTTFVEGLVTRTGSSEAIALRERLEDRGWSIIMCDAAFTLEALNATLAGTDETLKAAKRAERLNQLAQNTSDTELLSLINYIQTGGGTSSAAKPPMPQPVAAPPPKVKQPKVRMFGGKKPTTAAASSALAEPLLTDAEAVGTPSASALTELSLLHAISSLESLDVVVLLLDNDAAALELCSTLQTSSSLLPFIHQRQTSTPQILIRCKETSTEEILEEMHLPAFELTAVGVDAALPNLFAEVMHPEVHWSKECDNGA